MIKNMDADANNNLRDSIVARIERWLAREAPRVRDDDSVASIKFTISNPGIDATTGKVVLKGELERNYLEGGPTTKLLGGGQ